MKVLQINTTANVGSTGRIAEQIGLAVIAKGGESIIAYGVGSSTSQSEVIKISSRANCSRHHKLSKLTDMQGRFSTLSTMCFVRRIKAIAPDIIHLHNIHGSYLNYKILFRYLSKANIPVVWTLHDCWPITGHCSYFEYAKCNKWKTECYDCPEKKSYPKSLVFDRSRKNYLEKREIFNSVKNMTIVPVSKWLGGIVKESYLKKYEVEVIHNGIDIETFRPLYSNLKEQYNISDKKVILGVAAPWGKRKGFEDFIKLRKFLPRESYQIVMIGLSEEQMDTLPEGIIGLARTNSVEELAQWYSTADVFVNPTYEDTYPTTNLEAISCGTPVVTYKTGGSPESITHETGRVVEKGDIEALVRAIAELCKCDKDKISCHCRNYAVVHFDKNYCFDKYIDLYERLIKTR